MQKIGDRTTDPTIDSFLMVATDIDVIFTTKTITKTISVSDTDEV